MNQSKTSGSDLSYRRRYLLANRKQSRYGFISNLEANYQNGEKMPILKRC
jgi:hypothetical protein